MMITCIACKSRFEQKCAERRCGCKSRCPHEDFNKYLNHQALYFQHVIYQYHRLEHDESLSNELRIMKPIPVPVPL